MSLMRTMMTADGFREDVNIFDMFGDITDEQYEYLDSLDDADIDAALDEVMPEFSDDAMDMIAEETIEGNREVMNYLLDNWDIDGE